MAPEYVAELVGRILDDGPDVVGFSTTFAQNSAVLAAAKLIKPTAPEVVTVLGGGNFDGPQGAALHRFSNRCRQAPAGTSCHEFKATGAMPMCGPS